ncbi:ABC transporter ATP-binding protein [Saccharopolyspora phatthalungensis]|uniref:ABC-2 type transport system ATP-binding protein n=1 Tax=Saccharopolyspora phatthalungensis TaxID=664693 RepID=A0A840QIC3_9PSEU|nr:ATP-binding cassette domain-containing protein [Saccharopolyspora phatthalungensis]MBB5157123.1 ABC-2 type transport system ATP-binding protein [Saccharopolyspora phatthalungensis]
MQATFEHVSFYYGKRKALDDVTWQVRPGTVGLLGPNGAGKTTLLSLLVTLAKPKGGRITLGEHDLASSAGRREARKLLGFVPQRFSLAGELRLRDTVEYAAWVNGTPEPGLSAAADRALSEVGLADRARSRVRSLSGGQRQRLGVAAALAHDPKVVVLDEPTVGLDPGQRLRVRELVASIGRKRTVVLSSHLLEDISHLCQRVAVLAEGKLVFDGSVTQFQALVDNTDDGSATMGSGFERAYETLIARLGEP